VVKELTRRSDSSLRSGLDARDPCRLGRLLDRPDRLFLLLRGLLGPRESGGVSFAEPAFDMLRDVPSDARNSGSLSSSCEDDWRRGGRSSSCSLRYEA